MHSEVKATADVTKDNEAPALGSIKIENAAKADELADVGKNVTIVFELTDYNAADDIKVYLNDKPVTEKDTAGNYKLTGVDRNIVVVKAVDETSLKVPVGTVTYADGVDGTGEIQGINKTATYAYDAADIVARPSTWTGDKEIRLYTAWKVASGGDAWKAATDIKKDSGFTVWDSSKELTETTNYFKTMSENKIFIQAKAAGAQLWVGNTTKGSVEKLKPVVDAGPNLAIGKNGIWELTVVRTLPLRLLRQVWALAGYPMSVTRAEKRASRLFAKTLMAMSLPFV